MSALAKNPAGADWVNEPAVPDPADPIKAWLLPGAVKPAYQQLSDRIWSIASGAHTIKQIWVDGAGQQIVTMPNGVLAVVAGGGLQVRNGLTFIDLDADGVRATRQGRDCLLAAGGVFWVNPPALPSTTDARLALYPESRAVARALLQGTFNQGVVIDGSIGIKAIALTPLPNAEYVFVELAGAMASDKYHVEALIQAAWGEEPTANLTAVYPMHVSGRTTTGFYLKPGPNAPAFSAGAKWEITLTVYGRSA